jgi:imidazoleglycerol phosphate synthase glutamine amidotransferase subunit HisH
MYVAIIDYGSGNLHSAAKAFERAAREQDSKLAVKVTSEPEDVRGAERVVLPGVGAFADCRKGLERIPGMIEALEHAVRRKVDLPNIVRTMSHTSSDVNPRAEKSRSPPPGDGQPHS